MDGCARADPAVADAAGAGWRDDDGDWSNTDGGSSL
jgi:hypothetical protein